MAKKPMDRALRGLNQTFSDYKHKCYVRDRFWGLTLEQFADLAAKPCIYCGRPPSNKRYGFKYSGLDRLDNTKGYHPKNVVPCCSRCNSVKGQHLTHVEMLAAMEAVLKTRR